MMTPSRRFLRLARGMARPRTIAVSAARVGLLAGACAQDAGARFDVGAAATGAVSVGASHVHDALERVRVNGRFFAMGRQAGELRIYAGIRYRFDVDDGLVIARKVAARALVVGVPTDRPLVPVGR